MSTPPADPFHLVGSIIDARYRVESVVGHGGFGVVYRAFHLHLQGPIALKVLRLPADATAASRDKMLEAFRREGRVLFELSSTHPSIVQVKESGVVALPGRLPAPYLVLEWLEGSSLKDALDRRSAAGIGAPTLDQALDLAHPLAEALAATHEHGIAHRDIKPGNIFLSRAAAGVVPKILDFGIAKVVGKATSTAELFAATSEQGGTFTTMYGAPEQWLTRLGATGPWTDVYAFALVLVELVTGRPAADGSDPMQLMGAAMDRLVRPTPRTRGASIPEAVEHVFREALSVEPRERFRTMQEFWGALAKAAGRDPAERPRPISPARWLFRLEEPFEDRASAAKARAASAVGATLPTEDGSPAPCNPAPHPPAAADVLASGTFGSTVSAAQPVPDGQVQEDTPKRRAWTLLGMVLVLGLGTALFLTRASWPEARGSLEARESPVQPPATVDRPQPEAPGQAPSAPVSPASTLASTSLSSGATSASAKPVTRAKRSSYPTAPSPMPARSPASSDAGPSPEDEPPAEEILKNRK